MDVVFNIIRHLERKLKVLNIISVNGCVNGLIYLMIEYVLIEVKHEKSLLDNFCLIYWSCCSKLCTFPLDIKYFFPVIFIPLLSLYVVFV